MGDACAMKSGLRNAAAFAVLIAIILSVANFSYALAGSQIRCYRVAPKPWVCLTIDDGYSADAIKNMLSQLKRNNVKCTFFIIGCNLLNKSKQPLWRQAVNDGNEICYHSMNHRCLSSMSSREINADITAWENAARKVLGRDYKIPKFARLPGGAGSYNSRILHLFAARGYSVIRWNMDTLTGAIRKNISIKKYIKNNTRPGAIILTHFNTYDSHALPGYIGWLKSKFRLSRISNAFAVQPSNSPKPSRTPSPTPAPTETVAPIVTALTQLPASEAAGTIAPDVSPENPA